MSLPRKERLRRKRLAERERRAQIRSNPELVAERNRKRRLRYRKNETKRQELRSKRTPRDIRSERQKWREQKRIQKAKKELSTNSPDVREPERASSSSLITKQAISGMKRKERNVAQCYRENEKLRLANAALQRKVEMYRKRCYRSSSKSSLDSIDEMSPRTKLKIELRHEHVSPKVKKRLLLGAALECDMKASFSNIKSGRIRQVIKSRVKLNCLKKYKFVCHASSFFPRRLQTSSGNFGVRKQRLENFKKHLENYFQKDDVSAQAPGKKDVIVRMKLKKQKRYLTGSLKMLHRKFCEENPLTPVSYAVFCRFRPFWVIPMKIHERETCLCEKHENVLLLFNRLRSLKIVKSGSDLDMLIKEDMYCAEVNLKCCLRECEMCAEKEILYLEFDGCIETYYDTWEKVREHGKDGKTYSHIKKRRVSCLTYELVDKFSKALPAYCRHIAYIRHQYHEIDNLKKSLTKTDALIHVDFSENYDCKYNRELQSTHFGGNRANVTLHTGMVYKEKENISFCTLSEDLRHDPVAISSHLLPILDEYVSEEIQNIHFLSDSPSSQYRNKSMFYLMFHRIIPLFRNLRVFTWNYSESGHGKGAPDGIGACVKRTCDAVTACNERDVSDFRAVCETLKEKMKKIKVIPLDSSNNRDEFSEKIVESAKTAVKGKPHFEMNFLDSAKL